MPSFQRALSAELLNPGIGLGSGIDEVAVESDQPQPGEQVAAIGAAAVDCEDEGVQAAFQSVAPVPSTAPGGVGADT